jgi:GT2 family glycosyltransferase
MTLSIIILNYNSFQLTSDCIRSVLAHVSGLDAEVILVDNDSTECDPGKFLELFPSVTLVRSGRNGGFAFGNNKGIEVAKGEFILLLNSDTIIPEDSFSPSIDYFRKHPDTGVLGCRMTYPDGTIQYTARRFRSISWELLDLFRFIPFLMNYEKRSVRMLGKYFHHDRNMDCDWLNGAFFMFRKTILSELPGGKLDERFFMYGEDQLWCEQIIKLGYVNRFFAGTTIIHINSGSTAIDKQLALRKTMMKHELEIMRERKGKGLYYRVFQLIYSLKEGSRNAVKWLLFKLTGKLMR